MSFGYLLDFSTVTISIKNLVFQLWRNSGEISFCEKKMHHPTMAQRRFLFCRGWKLSSRPMNSTKTNQKTFGPINYIGQFVGHKSQASHLSSHPSSGVSFFTKMYDILVYFMNIWIYLNISWCILLYLTFFWICLRYLRWTLYKIHGLYLSGMAGAFFWNPSPGRGSLLPNLFCREPLI